MSGNNTCVIGNPVSHSLSPIMHNAAYQHLGLDWQYEAKLIEPPSVSQQILSLFEAGYRGLNVTMPYKEIAFDLSHPHSAASRLGSVNTLIAGDEGIIHGYSTDGQGFINSMQENEVELKGATILVVGAGGASRSISDALEKARANVFITSRRLEKSMEIVQAIVTRRIENRAEPLGSVDVLEFSQRHDFLGNCDIIINATPIGMTLGKKSNETPVDIEKILPSHTVVDTIYHPIETALLRGAIEKGARAFNGIGMLVHQGALAFSLMTGQEAPIGVMRNAILAKLNEGAV